jgi:hypothetical protein
MGELHGESQTHAIGLGFRQSFLLQECSDAGNSPGWVSDHVGPMEVVHNDEAGKQVFGGGANSTNGPLTPASCQIEAAGLSEARPEVGATQRWRQRCNVDEGSSSVLAMGKSGLGVTMLGYL